MKRRWVYYLVLLSVVAGGILATFGASDSDVDLSAPLAIIGRLVRDVDQVGLKATRVSAADETKVGRDLAAQVGGPASGDERASGYVGAIGAALTPHAERKGIRYTFIVVNTPLVNAFALPGGYVFVTTGMLGFVESEAELAAVIGHEVAHVDLRHCIERFQYRIALERLGLDAPPSALSEIGHWLVTTSYTKSQELEADAQGLRMAVQAGYDPTAASALFSRLAAMTGERRPARERTPLGEVAAGVGGVVDLYFQSHPSSLERGERLDRFVDRNRRRLSGTEVYVGRENHSRQVPRAQQEFPAERRRL